MNFKHIIAGLTMAAAAASSFAATTESYSGTLGASATLVDTITTSSGGFSSSFTFYNSTIFDAWITDGSSTYHYLPSGSGSISFGPTTVDWDSVALGSGALPSANWDIYVSGTAGASYTGGATYNALSGPVPSVPEPETYAMMLAGLGALGFVGRRRKAK
jgi:hypothetical protein